MKHPRHVLVDGARPAGAENSLPALDDFGLHEQIAEGRMQRIRSRGRENDFRITCDVDGPAGPRPIGDLDAAELDVVLGRNHDLGMRLQIEVSAAKLRAPLGKDGFVMFRLLERRLMRGRPELTACHVAQITERSPVVAGDVFTPARDRQIFPAAASAPGVRDHHVVAPVRQQLHFRDRGVGAREHAHRHLRAAGGHAELRKVRRIRMKRRGSGNAFLEQQQGSLKEGVRLEPFLHRSSQQQIGEGKQAHTLVMGHERPDDRARLAATLPRRRVVDGFEQAEPAGEPIRGKTLQVEACGLGRHHQRKRRRVRRHDQIFAQSAFQTQIGHTERAILIIEMDVDGVVPAFRNAPRHAAFPSILDLPLDRRDTGLIEQCILVGRHHQ